MIAGTTVKALNCTAAVVSRAARRHPATSAGLLLAGLGAVAVSVAGPGAAAPEFRTPPATVLSAPPVQVSAAAVYTGLAPYAPPAPARVTPAPSRRTPGPAGGVGSSVPVPAVTDDAATVLSGVRELPPEKTPTGTAPRTTAGSVDPGSPVTASVVVAEPRNGENVGATATVTGTVDMPAGHQVWLLSRHGTGPYRVEGVCPGDRAFTCASATLEAVGDDVFQLVVVVLDPATARTLQAGESRTGLPSTLARAEVTVHRAGT